MEHQKIGGIHLHYYAVCKRKLWLYDRGIAMEHESDRVLEGSVLHEDSYGYLKYKEVLIDNMFKLDAIDGEYVREVKISSKMTKADKLQMLFYLYQLELRGVKKKGLISYTKERKTEEVVLDTEGRRLIEQAIYDTNSVILAHTPPPSEELVYCSSCAYYALCYISEEGQ